MQFFFSVFCFYIVFINALSFAGKIFGKALKREFEQEDVYEIMRRFESSKLGDTLENECKPEKKQGIWWLMRPFLRMIWKEFLLLELSLIFLETPSM